jgi:hypothetical protein
MDMIVPTLLFCPTVLSGPGGIITERGSTLFSPYRAGFLPTIAPCLAAVAPILASFLAACSPVLAPIHSYRFSLGV